jgi:hypothetical protein
MTKGQKAMLYAMTNEPEKGGRGKLSRNRESLSKTMENRISQARSILRLAKQFDAEKIPHASLKISRRRLFIRTLDSVQVVSRSESVLSFRTWEWIAVFAARPSKS